MTAESTSFKNILIDPHEHGILHNARAPALPLPCDTYPCGRPFHCAAQAVHLMLQHKDAEARMSARGPPLRPGGHNTGTMVHWWPSPHFSAEKMRRHPCRRKGRKHTCVHVSDGGVNMLCPGPVSSKRAAISVTGHPPQRTTTITHSYLHYSYLQAPSK